MISQLGASDLGKSRPWSHTQGISNSLLPYRAAFGAVLCTDMTQIITIIYKVIKTIYFKYKN